MAAKKRKKPAKGERFEFMEVLSLIGLALVLIGAYTRWIPDAWNIPLIALISVILSFTNIKKEEFSAFLLAAVALTIVTGLNFSEITTLGIGDFVNKFLVYFKWLVAPATLILALRELWNIMKD